jgi:hypothetical protein
MWRVACGAGELKAEAAANRATKNSAWVQSLPALEQVPFAAFQATAGSITDTAKEAHSLVNIWLKRKDARPIVYNQGTNNIINIPLLLYIIPYDSYGTLITDNIAPYAFHLPSILKDL